MGQGRRNRKLQASLGRWGGLLFSRLSSSVLSPVPCPTQAAEYECRTKSGHICDRFPTSSDTVSFASASVQTDFEDFALSAGSSSSLTSLAQPYPLHNILLFYCPHCGHFPISPQLVFYKYCSCHLARDWFFFLPC